MARHLLLSTALQTGLFLGLLAPPLPVTAQPAPNARPTGGTVVGGSATIGRSAGATQITQSSQRAAIDWKSFDVGSQQSVTFSQPSSSAVALNRVTGPDPSQIAGRIDANGQIVLVNQSGVNFYKGAQVNAAGVMVSAANISTANFMAGRMVFDQPGNPNARIDNAGSITVKQAGLAALVAPQVANSGVITARLGHVVLAGAKTATLDLYGDGLLSLDVSNQVTQAPVGKDGKAATALVTNTGVIVADGGTVQLTARAADGIVQNLVQAGGRVRAATMGDQTGTIALNGVGGSIVVAGQLTAPSRAAGTKGGGVEIVASGDVVVAPTAKINASGKAGGGVVAIGTTLARAKGGPGVTPTSTAANVTVQKGATIAADAITNGDGGHIALLSTGTTKMDGAIAAKGGSLGGNGGFVEVSGAQNLSLTGTVDVSAPIGQVGTILLDPSFLNIVAGGPGSLDGSFPGGTLAAGVSDLGANTVSSGEIELLGARGDVVLQTSTGTIGVHTDVSTRQGLSLEAGGDLLIDRGVTINSGGTLFLSAGTSIVGGIPSLATGSILIGTTGASAAGAVLSAPFVVMQAGLASPGHPGIALADTFISNGDGQTLVLDMSTKGGGITQGVNGAINTGMLTSSNGVTGTVSLWGAGNAITDLQTVSVTGGDLVVVNATDLTLIGSITAQNLFFNVGAEDTLTFGLFPDGPATFPANLLATGPNGRISLVADGFVVASTQSTITTTAGRVEVAPASFSNISLGGTTGIAVDPALLSIIKTNGGTLEVGGFTDVTTGATTPAAQATAVSIDGAVDLTTIATTLRIDTFGGITEPGGPLTVNTLAGSAGSAAFTNAGNHIANLSTFTTGGAETSGDLTVFDTDGLTISGPVLASTLELVAGGALQIGTSSNVGILNAGTVTLGTIGAITEPNGTIIAGSLGVTVAGPGDVLLTNRNNQIALSTGITAADGNVVLADDPTLVLTGTYSGKNLFFEVSAAGGTIALGTPTIIEQTLLGIPATLAAAAGGRISLVADDIAVVNPASSITANAGTVELAPFSAITASLLGTSGLAVGAPLLSITHTGSGTLEVGGFTNAPAGATAPAASASSVNVGPADLTGVASTLRLDALGAITQSGGPLVVGALTGTAGTSASLTDPSNSIGTLGAFSTTAGFALVDDRALLVAGPVNDIGAASTVALTTLAGDIALAGALSAANVVTLVSATAIAGTGVLAADTLVGSAPGAISLTGANRIATIGNVGAGSITLNDTTDLLLAGTLNAPQIGISAPTSQISFGDGATIITGNTVRPAGALPADFTPTDGGAVLTAANFAQIGSSTIVGQEAGPATLQISTTGHAQFDPTLGLQGPNAWLILNLGAGTAAGTVFVKALDVIYTAPGSTDLAGTIANIPGGPAAAAGNIQPAVNGKYLFNGCIIGSAVCQPGTIVPPPVLPPPLPPTLAVNTNVGLTATLGAIYPLIAIAPAAITTPPQLSLIALPMLQSHPPELTDPDVVPPNITYLDY